MIKMPFSTGMNGRNERATKMMKTRCYRGDKDGNPRNFYESRSGGNDRATVVGVRVAVILPAGMKPEGFRYRNLTSRARPMGDSPAAAKTLEGPSGAASKKNPTTII